MTKRIFYSVVATIIYLIIANFGNLFFGVNERFSWTTTLWEALFFFIFIFLIQRFKKK